VLLIKRFVSCEFFTTAICNLRCEYCLVPKNKELVHLHKRIISKLKDGKFIDRLDSNLEYFAFWGTEPTLTLDYITPKIPFLLKKLTHLKEISFSSNFMTDPSIITRFIRELNKQNRKLLLKIQISSDGPEWITDRNRKGASASKIMENVLFLAKSLNEMELRKLSIDFHFKPTFTSWDIREINNNPELITEYFQYFREFKQKFDSVCKQEKVTLQNTCGPTLAVPGEYTSSDGKEWARLIKKIHNLGYLTSYDYRLKRLFDYEDELFTKPSMFTCSAGDSQYGLDTDGEVHMCHYSFYMHQPEYQSTGREKLFDRFILKSSNDRNKSRWRYILRNYHDFTQLRISYVIAMLKELALCGQADKRYLEDDELCRMFAIFINGANSCPADNLFYTGCIHFAPVSLLRMWSNGAFQELLKRRCKKNEFPKRKQSVV